MTDTTRSDEDMRRFMEVMLKWDRIAVARSIDRTARFVDRANKAGKAGG